MRKILLLLNVRPNEAGIVKQLFVIQFLLGIATAFLYTSSLTLFLSNYKIEVLPIVFIIASVLILAFNKLYAYFEHRLSPTRLLQVVVLFTLVSTFAFWLLVEFFSLPFLVLMLAAWTTLLYMLVGYAFWGLAALLFNVRESRRLFSIVSAGDIPAKMLGYLAVSLLVQFTGVANLLWISIVSLALCFLYVYNIRHRIHVEAHEEHGHVATHHVDLSLPTVIKRLFTSRLVFFISLVSFISFIIFSFVDFTFLLEIKVKYKKDYELASFIATFFAIGRFFAIFIKLLLTSRLIGRMGLLNALMITPVILLAINAFILFTGGYEVSRLYLFGSMVLLMEVLRSIIQEPVFFILFQPLSPHDRLKGHLIAKGYTYPLALLSVGLFLVIYLEFRSSISIFYTSTALVILIILWITAVFFVRKEYTHTLISSLKRGFFTGGDLFIDNEAVIELLIKKLESGKPLEIINSLNLLERSGYDKVSSLWSKYISPEYPVAVREYALSRIIRNNHSDALYTISGLIANDDPLSPTLYQALFFLEPFDAAKAGELIPSFYNDAKKSALSGLLLKKDADADKFVFDQLMKFAESNEEADLHLANEVLSSADKKGFEPVIEKLVQHPSPAVHRPAIETAGMLWAFDLLPKIIEVTKQKNAYHAFQVSLMNFGDEVFEDGYLPFDLDDKLIQQVIRAAAKVKGVNSDEYLVELLIKRSQYSDVIIHALWQKKADIQHHSSVLEKWFVEKLDHMKLKVDCFLNLHNNEPARLLEEALVSEIQQNVETLLKGFALLYERQQVDRFIEIYQMEHPSKLANAIELLELTIPKRHFSLLLPYIELKYDIKKKQVFMQLRRTFLMEKVLDEVVESHHAAFNSWSRSVALYLTPKLVKKELALKLASGIVSETDKKDELITETRNYILSILK